MGTYKPTESELASFCNGMNSMYDFSRDISPDAVVFPLRGAHPFYVSYLNIAELRGETVPDMLLLPLGTFTDLHTKKIGGLTKPEKIDVVRSSLDAYFADNPESRRILLVDEVMNGGTILTHFDLINWYMRNHFSDGQVRACAIEHGEREQRTRYKNRAKRYGFHRVRIESLFIMDREQYLPSVRRNTGFSVETDEGKLEDIIAHLEEHHSATAVKIG